MIVQNTPNRPDGATSHADSNKSPQEKRENVVVEHKQESISQRKLNSIAREIESVHNIGLKFSMHENTGKTLVRVTDKATNKVIRQIPSEEMLRFSENLDKMVGILFDKEI